MRKANIQITTDELVILQDKIFLQKKANALLTLKDLFSELRDHIRNESPAFERTFPVSLDITHGKISQGENYRGFPFLVLDFPKLFTKDTVFTFRSMFWWGHHFSFTFHLSGRDHDTAIRSVRSQLNQLKGKEFYLCVKDTPWEYHYEEDNYLPLDEVLKKDQAEKIFSGKDFIKLSRKLEISEWKKVIPYGTETFISCMKLTCKR